MSETKVDYKRGEYSFACQGCGENVVHELGRPLELMPSGRKVFPRLICPQCRADLKRGRSAQEKMEYMARRIEEQDEEHAEQSKAWDKFRRNKFFLQNSAMVETARNCGLEVDEEAHRKAFSAARGGGVKEK